ncbi:AmmeMemoRadiSam system protein A [Halococcoides cellulosivorans]|uniref:Protein HARCEL1_05670 n=1 Tax=Halococcoides cellulosivorans TaxID=1679096 RepID=A0A2R4X0A2_9EURY|nr:AmmeMemoRadiSam system protein A [Halococcoides cellulosivorans]AWB27224.1 AmmeMemoRadiSam system protein A [Halococcoides cellulosivorans]
MAVIPDYEVLGSTEGIALVQHARASIAAALNDDPTPDPPDNDGLRVDRGAFVTIRKDGEMRGCIGRPTPRRPLAVTVGEVAVAAATDDPRYPAMEADELDDALITVSVLTHPEAIDADELSGYLDAIEVGRDGLIVEQGSHRGLLLPQVAVDNDWTAQKFLVETCRKAQLTGTAYVEPETTVKRFSAQKFTEKWPSGEITQRNYIE